MNCCGMPLTSLYTGYLFPSSKLGVIEKELRSLYGESAPRRLVDRGQDNEEIFRLLEDLQEVISDYQVRPRP